MSGAYAIPYVMSKPDRIAGYIPVAPVGTEKFGMDQYQSLSVQTFIIYGELDKALGVRSAKYLSQIPNSKTLVIPHGQHPCYLDDPELFHNEILSFIKSL